MGSDEFLCGKPVGVRNWSNNVSMLRMHDAIRQFLHTSSWQGFSLSVWTTFPLKCPRRMWNPHELNSYQRLTHTFKSVQGEASLSMSSEIRFGLKYWRLFIYIFYNEDPGWDSVPENQHINTAVVCSDEEMPSFNHSQRHSAVPPRIFHKTFQILRGCNRSTNSQIQKISRKYRCFKKSFTITFQMLLCGECNAKDLHLKAYKLSIAQYLERWIWMGGWVDARNRFTDGQKDWRNEFRLKLLTSSTLITSSLPEVRPWWITTSCVLHANQG
jgi:hypothetical protein